MDEFLSRKELRKRIEEKIKKLPWRPLPGTNCDEFGYNPHDLKRFAEFAYFLYKFWFRVDMHGAENIPNSGACMIVPNHSGQLPFDGALIAIGCMIEKDPPRMPRGMVEKWMPTLPIMSTFMRSCGQVVGVTANAERILETGEVMLVFPEGAKGSGKMWDKRYQLQNFGVGFMELAIKYDVPLIPTAVVGGEEQLPNIIDARPIAKFFKAPYFPITPMMLLFGPALGLIPLPSTYHIYFGEPMRFGEHKDALDDPDALRQLADSVKDKIQNMVDEGLAARILPGL